MSPQWTDIYNSVSSIITGFLRPPPALHTHYSLVTADKGKVKGVVVSILHTERVMKSADTQEGPVSMLAASCGQRWRWSYTKHFGATELTSEP